jgi:hypothetical protein
LSCDLEAMRNNPSKIHKGLFGIQEDIEIQDAETARSRRLELRGFGPTQPPGFVQARAMKDRIYEAPQTMASETENA